MIKLARYVDVYVPVESCTLRCHYCYITTHRRFDNKLPVFKYSPTQIRQGLSQKRLGGPAFLSFCGGGETLLPLEMPAYFRELLNEGHYIGVVTNGTVNRAFDEIAKFPPEQIRRIFFKFSYHHFELRDRSLQDRFFSNVRRMRGLGAAVTVEVTPNDELIPYIEEIKEICKREVGAWPHVSVARDERDMGALPILTRLSRCDYEKVWGAFDSELFRFKMTVFGRRQPYFCHAGDWTFNFDLGSGTMKQCYCSLYQQNIIDDPTKPINFLPIGHCCLEPHCHNAHVFLGYGDMPELDGTRYDLERNRQCEDGTEWLNQEFKEIMHQRLCDNHPPYSMFKRLVIDVRMKSIVLAGEVKGMTRRVARKIRNIIR